MSTPYQYTGKATSPDLQQIHADVAASAMADKAIEGCTWHEDEETLDVVFTNDLVAGDQTLLDTIVANNS